MSLETLETKVDDLVKSHANLLGVLEGKVHGSPCPAILASLGEMQDKHIRPLEDARERGRGALWLVGAIAALGALLGVIEAVRKWLQ